MANMNRFFYHAAVLMALTTLSSFAQIHFQAGVVGGLSMFHEILHYSDRGNNTNQTKTGFVGGVVLDADFLSVMSIESGILYSQRGGQSSLDLMQYQNGQIVNSGNIIFYKNNLDVFAIPVHAKLKWPGLPIISPYALGGINAAFLVFARVDDGTSSRDFSSDINSMALAVDFGAGIEFELPAFIPFIEYTYDLGITNLLINPYNGVSLKTSGSEIKAGMRFRL
jgi:hypothetical protein